MAAVKVTGRGSGVPSIAPKRRRPRLPMFVVAVLVAVVGGALVGAGGAMPVSVAHACSCMNPTTRLVELHEEADATFVGTLVEIRRPEVALSSTAEARFVFEVDAVFKGERVRAVQSVVSPNDGASCGIELQVGATALVFGREKGFDVTPDLGEFASSLCEVARNVSIETATAALGPSRAPLSGSSPIGDDDGVASALVRNWYLIAGAVLLVGAWLIVRQQRRRRRAS